MEVLITVSQKKKSCLFLHDGVPKIRYLSVEGVLHATAPGIHENIGKTFERFEIKKII